MNATTNPTTNASSPQWVSITACPACGGTAGRTEEVPLADNKYGQLLRELGVTYEAMRLIDCQSCHSVYRSPWLTAQAMAPIYTGRYATHPDGISKFTTPDFVYKQGSIRGGAARLHRFLSRHVRPLQRYGEIGCPIWALLPYYEEPRYRLGGVAEVTADATVGPVSVGRLAAARHPALRLARAALGVRRVPMPSQLFWLEHGMTAFWGAGCRYNGQPCTALVRARALTTVPPDADIPGGPLDVLLMVHLLDHSHDPAALLTALSRRTRYLFIWTHGNAEERWSVQHLVSFSVAGLAQLAQRSGFRLVAQYPDRREADDYGVLLQRA